MTKEVKTNVEFDTAKALSEKFETMTTYDAEKGNLVVDGSVVDAAIGVLNEKLDLGLEKEAVQATFEKFIPIVTAAANLATGNVGIATMKANKDINQLSATFGLAKNAEITSTVKRQFETSPPGKPEEKKTHYGRVDSSITIKGSKSGDTSLLRQVRDQIYTKGESELK